MDNNKKEDIKCMDNEDSVNEDSKQESQWGVIETIGVILLIVFVIAVPVLAIVAIIFLVIAISQNKNANVLGGISKVTDFMGKASHNSSNIHVNPINMISNSSALSKNECINSISDTVGEAVKRRGYSEPFNVSPYIRNLPMNQHPSAEKLAFCLENGIALGENQTFVNGYTKGMDL